MPGLPRARLPAVLFHQHKLREAEAPCAVSECTFALLQVSIGLGSHRHMSDSWAASFAAGANMIPTDMLPMPVFKKHSCGACHR